MNLVSSMPWWLARPLPHRLLHRTHTQIPLLLLHFRLFSSPLVASPRQLQEQVVLVGKVIELR